MSLLTSNPLAGLLERLFAETDDEGLRLDAEAARQNIDGAERARLLRDPKGWRALYGALADFGLPASRETAKLLYLLTRATRAQNIVEFGASFGISTLHLAAALRENGGGRVISTEFEPAKILRARENFRVGGLEDLIELREGDAVETLARDLPETIDLLFLDGAKPLYGQILDLVAPNLRAGALVVADNADFCPEFLQRLCGQDSGYVSLPFGPDVELAMRLG